MTSRNISLANKCQLLFGLALLVILVAALSVPWFRMQRVVERGQFEIADQLAEAWLTGMIQLGAEAAERAADDRIPDTPTSLHATGMEIRMIPLTAAEARSRNDAFLSSNLERFKQSPKESVPGGLRAWDTAGQTLKYRYLRAIFESDLEAAAVTGRTNRERRSLPISDNLWGVLLIERSADEAAAELTFNRAYIILSGLFALAIAILVFYFITTKLILSPVRVLRDAAERVSRGDLYIRSDIATGDEFEELSNTFNLMLANLKSSQDQLRQINKSLDLRMNELMQSNTVLAQGNRLKSEFIANVSHELRTPLNSILGFAEVVSELEAGEPESPARAKKIKYLMNIINSGRALLEMINDLLDLAKIEAGRLEINVEPTSVRDVCESLATLIRPQADKKKIVLTVSVPETMPLIETDAGRMQQIIFNFLSNAVKFTPESGSIRLWSQRTHDHEKGELVRISVTDTGPGIRSEDQAMIFEKFRQLDQGHARQYSGTGLGLAICRELSALLGGSIELESRPGEGSTFSLILPLHLKQKSAQPLMPGA